MPRLLLFAPCQRVLIGQDNLISLIEIMNEITLSGEIPDPLPERAATQMKWSIFAQWEASNEDIGQRFEQRIQMVRDDVVAFESMADFTIEAGKPVHRMVANLTFFPLVPGGAYRMLLSIRRSGTEEWEQAGDYPFNVIYRHIAVPAGNL
jgi:hypothetical protein